MAPQPLNADEIADALEFSPSNVSTGLKELQAWQLAQLMKMGAKVQRLLEFKDKLKVVPGGRA